MLTMSQESNHELFYLCCAKALSGTYEDFPKFVDINLNVLVGVDAPRKRAEKTTKKTMADMGIENDKLYIAKQTIDWLVIEGYIRFTGEYEEEKIGYSSCVFRQTSLPHKTLHVLNKKVDLYTDKGSQKLAVWVKQALEEKNANKILKTVDRILAELIKTN